MRWAEGFIAVDWGTTNRRAYLVDGDGRCTAEFEDDRGVLAVPKSEFPAAVDEIRQRLGDRPMLLAGMAGSNRGWVEAPYVPCPIGLDGLSERLVWAEPGKAAIVPGLSYLDDTRADIMRGEEVQILGAAAEGLIPQDCRVCHPGTHNKWIELAAGAVVSFRTVMTGELFNLLRERSILSEHLAQPAAVDDWFHQGVQRGFAGGLLTAELFSVRARTLLGRMTREQSPSFVSGLLIGADVKSALELADGAEVIVIGRPELTKLYAAAIGAAGGQARELDGEGAFLAGAKRIVERLQ